MTANPPTPQPPRPRIDELDGLRGILALWVALAHIFCWCGLAFLPPFLPHGLGVLAGEFWVEFSFSAGAVDTFIILSGFAISYLLHTREQTYGQFMIGRFFRIVPVYLVCLLAGWATIQIMPGLIAGLNWRDTEFFVLYVKPVLAAAQAHPVAHLLAHLSLLFGVIPNNILPHAPFTLLAPAWSISLEWQYYLLAPFLAWFAARPIGLLVLGLVSFGDVVYAHFWGGAFLPEKLPLFLIGIGSYHLYVNADKFKPFRLRPQVFAGLLAAALMVQWHWLALVIWVIVFGGVLADAGNPAERLLLKPRRILLHPLMQFVGKISYPLYLVHWPVIIGLMAALMAWQPGLSPGTALATMLVAGVPIILFAAWLLHRWVEKPLMQFGKKFTR
jgi:peptidoglycan/LPS O-acetylase OafA/YrhL